jgi:hypothetical protein
MDEERARNPLVVWYRIHPDNGRLEKLAAPPTGGATHRDSWDNEHWRPMPDGSVKMGMWDTDKLSDKVKAFREGAKAKFDPKKSMIADGQTESKEADGAAADAENGSEGILAAGI